MEPLGAHKRLKLHTNWSLGPTLLGKQDGEAGALLGHQPAARPANLLGLQQSGREGCEVVVAQVHLLQVMEVRASWQLLHTAAVWHSW